ncbi:MAG: adenine deaminase C-terminal domain-containing protein [Candidatus Woesearchaeota archaeon]
MNIEGNFIDVRKGEIYPAKITFTKTITKIERNNKTYTNYIAPGFVEAHIRFEESYVSPSQYVKFALESGVTTVVEDFSLTLQSEGATGVKYYTTEFNKLPINYYYLYPINIFKNKLESSADEVSHDDFMQFLKNKHCLGLTQVDDVMHIQNDNPLVMKKILAAQSLSKPIISNIPKIHFTNLSKFATLGIRADIGSNIYQEAFEKACFGLKIKIVEGTKRKTLASLVRLAKQFETSIVSDEKSYQELSKGYMKATLKKAVSLGLDPVTAIQNVTCNPAQLLGINEGVLEEGAVANIVELENLRDFSVLRVFHKGECVVKNSELSVQIPESKVPKSKFSLETISEDDIHISSSKESEEVLVLNLESNQLESMTFVSEDSVLQKPEGVLKVVVASVYGTNQIGIGYVKGITLEKGAVATNMYGSSSNIIAVGNDDDDLAEAINRINELGGGFVAVDKKREVSLHMPILGLTTNQDPVSLHEQVKKVNAFLRRLGYTYDNTIETIADLKDLKKKGFRFTDNGVIDVANNTIVNIFKD